MDINLELYKTFYYVAKNKNISKAAKELLISQPAVSKSIKTLEHKLKTTLFIRKNNGLELTDVGEAFYTKIKDAMELIESAENDLDVLTSMDTGILNIGASKTILHETLMPYIKDFHEKYPRIKIKIFTDKTLLLINKSKMGIIDVLFTNLPHTLSNEFEYIKIKTLHDCLVANKSFNNLKDKKIELKELENLPILTLTKGTITRERLDDYCEKNNVTINPEMEFTSTTLVKEFTEAGFGIGLLTEELIKKELKNGELFKLDIKLPLEEKELGMIYNKENKSLVARNFTDFIKDRIENKKS